MPQPGSGLELQGQQNAALSPRNRGHRIDTKNRNSISKKKKRKEKKCLIKPRGEKTSDKCTRLKGDNGKCKEYVRYMQDFVILYATEFALFG